MCPPSLQLISGRSCSGAHSFHDNIHITAIILLCSVKFEHSLFGGSLMTSIYTHISFVG